MQPTPLNKKLSVKTTGFANLADVLDYAATGETGFNFYDHRGELEAVLSYRALREEASTLARRLLGLG
ncbi:MAG: fatty acyl-AMP ligase, partial [Gammaproteobacteria bacterium]|nr:fatty acyl-AMP ligase [Gammaproteobacteria bacterium]